MNILIPTYHREENQKCWNALPDSIKKKTFLCTHTDRVGLLRKHNPEANIVDIGVTDGIADVRQKLLDISREHGETKVLIVDDSCTFMARHHDTGTKLHPITEEEFHTMLSDVEVMLDSYPMVGISDRMGNNRFEVPFKEVGRSYSCYGINVAEFARIGVRFDGMYQKDKEVKLYEDFYVILSLLTKGYRNAINFNYAFSHAHGKAGGNSVHRTNALQLKCLQALQREFPGLVEIVKKEDPSWKAGDGDEFRWDARISWQEAASRSGSESLDDLFG